jgi:hypothetical protein
MRHSFGTFVLVAAVLFCLFTAWSSGFTPKEFAARLGLTIASADGYNEIRAQYSGFFLMTGAICVAAMSGAMSRRSAFIVLAVIFGGLITGRLASLAANRGFGGYTSTILALYAIDATGLILALTAMAIDKGV